MTLTTISPTFPGRCHPAGRTVVIVGAGQAGSQAAVSLRERGFSGRVILLGDEPSLPYMRPPLSKRFLAGEEDETHLLLRPASFYAGHRIECRTGERVEAIEREGKRLRLASGERLAYDRLLLATGSRPRTLAVPGTSLPGIHGLRTIGDAARLRDAIAAGRRVVVVGGGYLGLEVAAAAAAAGARVTVVEIADRLLVRVTTPEIAAHLEQLHRAHGVEIRCGTRVTAFAGGERLAAVETDRGTIAADLAVVGIGAVPNDELARASGLACEDGILVDEFARTADPCVYAAGDCTRHPNPLHGRPLRLESVQNAVDQAGVAAANIAGGALRYRRVPWFWSQQYDCRLQSAGLPEGYDTVEERGDRGAGRFALRYRRAGELVAVDAVNLPGEYLSARREIERRLADADAEGSAAALPRQRVA
jgi:3-phenylpropionate/trans-cinnamate dioxygenase ferredoxin reductase subunit